MTSFCFNDWFINDLWQFWMLHALFENKMKIQWNKIFERGLFFSNLSSSLLKTYDQYDFYSKPKAMEMSKPKTNDFFVDGWSFLLSFHAFKIQLCNLIWDKKYGKNPYLSARSAQRAEKEQTVIRTFEFLDNNKRHLTLFRFLWFSTPLRNKLLCQLFRALR